MNLAYHPDFSLSLNLEEARNYFDSFHRHLPRRHHDRYDGHHDLFDSDFQALSLEEGLHQRRPHYEAAYSLAVVDVTFELEEAEQYWQMRAHLVLMLLSQKTLK